VTIGRGCPRWLALVVTSAPLLGAAPQKPAYTEETVPSEAAKRHYELCAAEGQAPAQAIERCQAALRHGLSGRVAVHVHILIGWAHWALGEPAPAADSWRAAARFEPRDPSLPPGVGLFLEAAGRTAGVRVILSSGYDSEEARGRFGACRPAGFIQKPYRPEQLVAEIGRWVGQALA
jgi:hypothetical protein